MSSYFLQGERPITTLELDTTRLYGSPDPISDADRVAICAWMRDNGLDPDAARRIVVHSNGTRAWAEVFEIRRTPQGVVKLPPRRVDVSGLPALERS